jgi:YidC/Oxa1 family membrane protein insertase
VPVGGRTAEGGTPEDAPDTSRTLPFAGEGYVAEFQTRGASLVWLELTDYHTAPGATDHLRLLSYIDGKTPSLLVHDFSDQWGLDRTNWEVVAEKNELGRDRLVFTKRLDNGLVVLRTVNDRGVKYAFDMSLEVRNEGGADMAGTLTLVQQGSHGLLDENDGATFMMTPPTALAVVRGPEEGTALTKWAADDLATGAPRRVGGDEALLAAGAMTNYFTALLVPLSGTQVAQVQPQAVPDELRLEHAVEAEKPASDSAREALRAELAPKFAHNAATDLLLTSTPPAVGKSLRWDFSVYAGPLDSKLGDGPDHSYLHPVIEERHGSMAWINHALLATLRFFHSLVGNWGVAIILLTLLVRILLFPLNRVQQSSMQRYSAAMQRLKPQIDALKAKYKNNMRKFNEEQMQLLKQEGVRPPLGGCLLIFLQFPIWVSLFQILRSHIELRHAPFYGWVHDLSSPDRMPFPFLVSSINLLPILMAAAQVVQMRLQPPPADPSQAQMQRMMGLLMPVMMLFFLYNYPSGLSLYIFTSSLFGIIEYQIVKKLWPVPVVAPAAVPPKGKGKG